MEFDSTNEGIENLTDITRVTEIIKKLSEILQQEYEHIKNMEIAQIEELQEAKIPLMKWLNIFQNYVTMINPKFFEEIEEDKREHFFISYQNFQNIVKQNYQALDNAIAINHRVADVIYQDIKKERITNVYSKNAALSKFSMAKGEAEDERIPIILDISA